MLNAPPDNKLLPAAAACGFLLLLLGVAPSFASRPRPAAILFVPPAVSPWLHYRLSPSAPSSQDKHPWGGAAGGGWVGQVLWNLCDTQREDTHTHTHTHTEAYTNTHRRTDRV